MTVSEIIEILYGDIVIRNEEGKPLYNGKPYHVPQDMLNKEVFYMMPLGASLVIDIK